MCDSVCALKDPYYLYVVGVQVCTNVLFRDVGWDTFQYQPGFTASRSV